FACGLTNYRLTKVNASQVLRLTAMTGVGQGVFDQARQNLMRGEVFVRDFARGASVTLRVGRNRVDRRRRFAQGRELEHADTARDRAAEAGILHDDGHAERKVADRKSTRLN